jgi:UDP-N-acetylglucosamine acyltransferase
VFRTAAMKNPHGAPPLHPTAVIDPRARLAADVSVGPYCVIGPEVEIGSGCSIAAHVVITGATRLGDNNRVYPFACLGEAPQDKKYAGETTQLVIGNDNCIREYVTINRGTVADEGVTRIGDANWIMAYVHIAHDCRVGSHTVFANHTTLAGHVQVADHVTLGGATLVHQFCRIGAHVFSAYGARINKDVPPFILVGEGRARPRGINAEGLRRRGFSHTRIGLLRQAYRVLYRSGLGVEEALRRLQTLETQSADVAELRAFVAARQRSIVR